MSKKPAFGLGVTVYVPSINKMKVGEVTNIVRQGVERALLFDVKPKRGKAFIVTNNLFSTSEGEALEMRLKMLQSAYAETFAAGKPAVRLAQLAVEADNDLKRWMGMMNYKYLSHDDLKKLPYFKAWGSFRINVAASACNRSQHPDAIFLRNTLMKYPKLSEEVQRIIDVEKILLLLGVFGLGNEKEALKVAA